MRVDVVTLFPEMFEPFLSTSITGRAIGCGALTVGLKQLREHGLGKYKAVDDTPYGGGSGMVMRVDCIVAAMEAIDSAVQTSLGSEPPKAHRVLLSPQGARLDQRKVIELAARERLVLVCGRYEGFDDRVSQFIDEEISLGDFVLAGGEVAAMAIIDAVARLLPGAVGNAASLVSESHSPEMDGWLEYPQYTRPAVFRGHGVPDVLTSGDHGKIAAFRRDQAMRRTAERRPDLLAAGRGATRGDGDKE
ncbi:MAG: tRNA (guanosine(37)-N1)-methyltransferase TrmD [Polyangiaceae bacterium]|nr:tRNA (guanosine(37)-N1)-methyltransferase TrmD [Polyangiaceae bacterium]